jgi:signal transduction histidine kinase/integral membrane sensor domain MASE1/CheY-like chemotaxis protein
VLKYLLKIALVAVVYFAAAELGLSLAFLHANVSPVWPPTGVAVAALFLLGYRVWPGVLIGAFAANVLTPVPIETTLGIAAGNTLEALTTFYLLWWSGFKGSLDRAKHVTRFVVALAVGTMVAATVGNISLCLGQAAEWKNFGSLWLTWWLGDLVGGLVVAPLILAWGTITQQWLPKERLVEGLVLSVLLSIASMIIFAGWFPSSVKNYPLAHLAFPFVIWAAFRLGHRGVTLAILFLSTIAIWGTRHHFGPYARVNPNESLLLVQVFVGSVAVMAMYLTAVVEERRIAARTLRQGERRLEGNLAVTRILAESPALGDATPRILQTVCETLNWEVGGLWIPMPETGDAAEGLHCLRFWRVPGSNFAEFETVCRQTVFLPGIGLPGRVWTSRRPAWIPDVRLDNNFPRAPIALNAGLHAAFAFPIMFGEKFLGVMEFFSHEIRQPDNAVLAMFGSVGSQIGQFMERKHNEEEREKLLNSELAARAEAEKANRTKDEFLAIVSHELRTPLNAVVGWASLLRTGSLDEGKSKRAIEVIDRNARAQAQLIEDILDVSRIVSGNLRLDPQPVQLQTVIEAAIDSVRPMADAKSIRLLVQNDSMVGPVSGDPDRLQQVVWNLLSNAVKFTPAGGEVSVSLMGADSRAGADSHAEVVVSDTGQGIGAEFLPFVFDRFRQADGSKTRRHGGLGLGLTIVRNLVELHGGRVSVQSEGEGRGTTFTIRIPCIGIQPRSSLLGLGIDSGDGLRASEAEHHKLDGIRILVVEDDKDSREMMEMVLRSQGAEVVAVDSVAAALRILDAGCSINFSLSVANSGDPNSRDANSPDRKGSWYPTLLISDLGMPDQDGYDLIRELRRRESLTSDLRPLPSGGLPAIAITGYAGNDEGKLALAAGFQKHLTKPVDWRALIETITNLAKSR